MSFLHLGEGRCQPCFSPLALATYVGRRAASHSVVLSTPLPGCIQNRESKTKSRKCQLPPLCRASASPWDCVGGAQTWASITEEPVQGGSWPGASCSLGEGPGMHSVLSSALALPQLPTWGSCTGTKKSKAANLRDQSSNTTGM